MRFRSELAMKIFKLGALLFCAGFILQACSEENFVKVFKCPEEKPYLNVVNNRCYSSAEAAEEVNKLIETDKAEENGTKSLHDDSVDAEEVYSE